MAASHLTQEADGPLLEDAVSLLPIPDSSLGSCPACSEACSACSKVVAGPTLGLGPVEEEEEVVTGSALGLCPAEDEAPAGDGALCPRARNLHSPPPFLRGHGSGEGERGEVRDCLIAMNAFAGVVAQVVVAQAAPQLASPKAYTVRVLSSPRA
jgi:hypothetical protein